MISRMSAKNVLGEVPLTAEAYWYLRQGGKPPRTGFKLNQLSKRLPKLISQASHGGKPTNGKNILIFCTLHFWISHGAVLGLALSGQGHRVTLAYMPYQNSSKEINRFDLRRQNVYAKNVLNAASPKLESISFYNKWQSAQLLPPALLEKVDEVSFHDTQYIMQIEDIPR